jgi:hypothetical protein
MREFGKSRKLDNVLYDVRGPVVDEAARMEENGTNVLKLNIGNPAPFGFRTPDEVIYDMSRQLTDCEGYSNSKGLFSARKAIMQYAQLKKLPNVTVEDIYTGNGVSELINLSMSALLDNGDEVLVPAPDYPLWTACVTLAGGTAVHYICAYCMIAFLAEKSPLELEYPSQSVSWRDISYITSSGVLKPNGAGFPILSFNTFVPFSSMRAASSTTGPLTS